MRLGTVVSILGWLLVSLSLAILLPIGFSLYYRDNLWHVFLISSALGLCVGVPMAWAFVAEDGMGHREGFAIVGFGWMAAAALGAMPYWLSGAIPDYVDAYFESMSGFTTTGSTILREVEVLGPSLLFWRALTHWLGGMGIIVLSIAILPVLGIGGMQLFQAEMPGPTKDRLAPRIQDTARILWGVYVLLTSAEVALLMLGGMDLFNAICHAFATMATGGFSTVTASVGGFQSAYIDAVIICFMVLAGINFSLHHRVFSGDIKSALKSEELRIYLGIGLGATAFVTLANIVTGTYSGFGHSLRYSAFQVWSILTTTGFGTADFDTWAPACKTLLVTLMFIGGMAGSTGGGIKHVRILLFCKYIQVQFRKLIHPRSVDAIKLDGRRVPPEVMQSILGFFSLYMVVFVVATLLVTTQGVDMITGATSVVATLNNIGPGLGGVGPARNYAELSGLAKVVLIMCMLAGRLELYTVAILCVPAYWKDLHPPKWRWKNRG